MKKVLLALVSICTLNAGISQCTPNPLYADSIFGVWPDTIENFPPAILGAEYFTQLDVLVPVNAALIPDTGLPPLPIDSGSVTDVFGLPSGITYECNSQTSAPCTFLGGELGCGILVGTPMESGTFEIDISVTAHLSLFGSPISAPVTFGGYEVVVSDTTVSVTELTRRKLLLGQNVPNPFDDRTIIPFELIRAQDVELRVMNLLGVEIFQDMIDGSGGKNEYQFSAADIPEGIYLYSISTSEMTVTRRMVIGR